MAILFSIHAILWLSPTIHLSCDISEMLSVCTKNICRVILPIVKCKIVLQSASIEAESETDPEVTELKLSV